MQFVGDNRYDYSELALLYNSIYLHFFLIFRHFGVTENEFYEDVDYDEDDEVSSQ